MNLKIPKKVLLMILFFLLHPARLLSGLSDCEKILFAYNITAFDVWGEDELLLGGDNGQLVLFNLLTGSELFSNEMLFREFQSSENSLSNVTAVAKIPNKEKALVAFANGEVSFFCRGALCLDRKKYLIRPSCNHSCVRTIQISPDGNKALLHYGASSKEKGVLEIWNLDEEKMIARFEENFVANTCSIVSSKYFIGLNNQKIICLYDLNNGACTPLTDISAENVSNLVVERVKKLLVVTTFDGVCFQVSLATLDNPQMLSLNQSYSTSSVPIFFEAEGWIFVRSSSVNLSKTWLTFYSKEQEFEKSYLLDAQLKTTKIFNQNKVITLLDNGDLIGWALYFLTETDEYLGFDIEDNLKKLLID